MKIDVFDKRYRAVLFDLDGTLINSMGLWEGLLTDFISQKGLVTDGSLANQISFMTLSQSSEFICQKFPELNMTGEQIKAYWIDMAYEAYKNKIKLKNGAKQLLEGLKKRGVTLAIVTACPERLAEASIKSNGIDKFIDFVVYAEKLGINKENPEIYKKALEMADCTADNAVLFEDIRTALDTAKKIGIKTIIMEDDSAISDREYLKENADMYIKDFTEVL